MADTIMSQHISITTPDLRAISQPAAMDPDISATLSDFLTYTEHLPSAVTRSFSLIGTLNKKARLLQTQIHDMLTTYSELPTIPLEIAPDPVRIRRDISHAYVKLEECKRMSAAEAARIEDMVARDGRRLDVVRQKLKALPMPPSRDATPEPMAVDRKQSDKSQVQQSADKRVAAHRTTTAPRVRNRDKLMVPGEVLPPPNPDSPPASEPDDWTSPPRLLQPSNAQQQQQLHVPRQKSVGRQKTPKAPRQPKPEKERDRDKDEDKDKDKDKLQKTPRSRPPGMPGTNAHSAVAGISTSNAIMALTKPPPDAVIGGKWLPWKTLTEYELAVIRKEMKKNAAWRPSQAMRNKKLRERGRGIQAMEQARQEADANASEFVDVDATWKDPTVTSVSDEQQAEMNAVLGPEKDQPSSDEILINRGMRLNEAKKLKREKQKAAEMALENSIPKPDQMPDTAQQPLAPEKPKEQKPTNPPHQSAKKPTKSKPAQSDPPDNPPKVSIPSSPPPPPPLDIPKADPQPQPKITDPPPVPAPPVETAPKKRKRDLTPPVPSEPARPAVESSDVPANPRPPGPERKKLKINPPAPPPPPPPSSDPVATVPSPKPSTPAEPSTRTSNRSRSQQVSAAPADLPVPPPPPPPTTRSGSAKTSTTITLKRQKAASAEPPLRKSLRRGSNASSLPDGAKKSQSPAPKREGATTRSSGTPQRPSAEPPTNAGRQSKRRPAPGVVAAQEDGSATVSTAKRKKPPAKKQAQQNRGTPARGTPAPRKEEIPTTAPEEEIDPNEERYCICGDVSWGPMICCDNSPNCEKEWFHWECVGLKEGEMPPRRAKWYCPDCRKKLKLGVGTNGIVPPR